MMASSLRSHDQTVARDLDLLGLPAANWPAPVSGPNGQPVTDVLIVGAGMNGIAATASLMFKGVRNITMIDRAAPGHEGPWLTYARMGTLRSPKTLPGPALNIPSLTYRAWHEASFGLGHWNALYKIPNQDWAAYLAWFQKVLKLPVQHRVALTRVEPVDGLLRVTLQGAHGKSERFARRVILATGRGGTGGDAWPDIVDRALVPTFAAHTNDDIDFARLRGRRIAILGGGASAWDNAATALEQGAAQVDMYVRRTMLPQVNKGRGSAFPGFLVGWSALSDAERWQVMVEMNDVQSPVPHETIQRTLQQANFQVELGSHVQAVNRSGDGIELILASDPHPRAYDFLIAGTGFRVDARAIPELAAFSDRIARWGDVYAPPPELQRGDLALHPYLGPGFELTDVSGEHDTPLSHIHLVNHGAALSHTAIASDIPGVNIAAERIATAITASLFREDFEVMRQRVADFDEPELLDTPFFVPKDER